ncbi:MAG: hypothetical protein NT069_30285, partial [Planctomycetota bacterium]|nr:hypothetical protein [Planctomycetota bacterium]
MLRPAFASLLLFCIPLTRLAFASDEISAADYESIQAALDANPGRMIFVPAGDHVITRKLRFRGDGAGLCGRGRIIQQTSNEPIVELEAVHAAEIRDVTLTRPSGAMETENEAILAIGCRDLVIDNVRAIDNR